MREYSEDEAAEVAARFRRKAERRAGWAESADKRAMVEFDKARDSVAGIPMGQPILVDHYSAKRHRSALARQDGAMRRGVEAADKATEHGRKAKAQAAWADEVERRGKGARYTRSDLLPGDRLVCSNGGRRLHSVVVRANAKSVTAYPVHGQDAADPNDPSPIWPQFGDLNPGRLPYLKIRSAWRLADGVWAEVLADA